MTLKSHLTLAGCLFGLQSALAYGPWLDATPFGGVELGGPGAVERAELNRRLDAIEAATASAPYLVTRTKMLVEVFDHCRLAVNTNDLFVHWHADSGVMPGRREQRLWGKLAKLPDVRAANGLVWGAEKGAYFSYLDTSHTCPDWKSVLDLGPKGLADRARARRETAKTDDERLFLDCVAEVYDALARQTVRWAAFAEEKGMSEVAAVLRENAAHPPRTFREALQWALVYDRAQESEGEDVRSQGLFDRLFIDFYRADLKAGRETRESAKRLLSDWYTRLWTQGHPNNKNLAFGGYDAKGEPVWNELTELGIEVFRELGRVNPKLTFRVGRKTPQWQLEQVTACHAEGKTSIVFACDETLYEALRRRGKEESDLCDYLLVGCYEPGVGGRELIASMSCCINLVHPFDVLFARPDADLPADADAFEAEFAKVLEGQVDRALAGACAAERHWYEFAPSPLFSGSFRDCIASARDVSQGGCRYNSSGVVLIGLGTAADSLAAVRALTTGAGAVSMKELAAAVRANWKGFEQLQLRARRQTPKWGNNDERVDSAAKLVYSVATKRVNGRPNGHGGTFNAGSWTIYLDMTYGKMTGATPDGRVRGETLSRNNAATAGCGKEGPTALMLSNLKLDLAESPNGHILGVMLPASITKSRTSAADIAALLRPYLDGGGNCLHLNCFDSKMLKDAFAHPEKYPDLQVRVCGWNVQWTDLSVPERLHFLKTAEAQEQP